MDECANMDRIAAMLEAGASFEQASDVAEHLRTCERCREQLSRMNWLAVAMGEMVAHRPRATAPGHPDDLNIAAFTIHGTPSWRVDVIEAHLADCDDCLLLVAALRRQMEEADEILGPRHWEAGSATWLDGLRMLLGTAFSTRGRALAFLGACGTYAVACLAFGAAMAAPGAWLLLGPDADRTVPDWGPLGYIPDGPLRLGALSAIFVILGLLARLLALRLYQRALRGA